MIRRTTTLAMTMLAACSLVGLEPDVANRCVSDDDCGRYACDTDRGMCVAAIEGSYDVVLEVTPNAAASAAPPTWQSGVVALSEAREWPVRFDAYVEVRGTIRWAGQRVPAEIIFSRPGLEGRPVQRFRTDTFAEVRIAEDEEYDFALRLPAGGVFDVEVRPSSATLADDDRSWLSVLPPLRFERPPLPTAEPGDPGPLILYQPFNYPDVLEVPCTRDLRSGCALAGSVVAMEEGITQPQEGLQVRAVDEGGQVVSSAAVTDAEGVFSLVVSPGAGPYVLRVSASSDRPLFPTILVDPAFLTEELRIRVPVTQVVTYEGMVESPAEEPLPGATITFRSDSVADAATGIAGSFETTVTSDEAGRFSATLLAGEYEVVVTPLTSRYTVLTEELTIAATEGVDVLRGQLFEVSRSSQLGATIVDFLGRELPSATAEAAALAVAFEDLPASRFNRSQMATADETGQLALPLDVGAYDVTFRGGANAGYPWRVMPEVEVLEPGQTITERIELQAPVPIGGDVLGPDGTPLVDAEVRALARTESGRFVEIARGRTDGEGVYELLLPPSL